ncbi:alpha-L-rhamnosidase [Paenibacillus sp. UNCCL117]|uniref:alpha-L-rhamnosidase n=1 Tax=unclassified Paenibacillus TaxID=185978 RepID=UPI00088C8F7C|nr:MULTISPECIES: alpha-L-rhamnosidase [unclassified Paenibacillus]SDC27361.1 alpha-L-rhamnosidase [Paenibacillus sp. cl123]SFW20315.1 alpha-L-rhamnosidase [Paenibacillus sp. UNCCL117]
MDPIKTSECRGKLTRLRCEYLKTPLGIDKPQPKLSWEMKSTGADFVQNAYRIIVSSHKSNIDNHIGDMWDSHKVVSNLQNAVIYNGCDLASKSRYWWKVKIWDHDGNESPWSEETYFETGMFKHEDWQCRWFNCEYPNSPTAIYYERREFITKGDTGISSARAYIGATGSKANSYELRMNGVRVGEDLISPGQTHFKRGMYRTFDVTDVIKSGPNAIGIMHARKVIFHLDIRYADGTSEIITSDPSWKRLKKGPYLALRYAGGSISEGKGETYDARLEPDGWDMPGYDDSLWGRPISENGPLLLTAQIQPIKCMEEIKPVSISKFPGDTYVVDFGQNMFGTLSLAVEGTAGTKVTLRYAECMNSDGTINSDSIEAGWLAESQPQFDEYILKGIGEETYQPKFSCHGFRYVEVSGYPGKLTADQITAKVVHNDILNGSEFSCSNDLFTKLQHSAMWSFRSNLVSVPMDCPSRERQGWLGDAHCHSEADCINFDMAAFFDKWFDDISDCQLENGMVPLICPSEGHEYSFDMPWVSAVIFIPWDYYMAYGDRSFIGKHYPLMEKCLNSFRHHLDSSYLLQNSLMFGDWFGSAKDISKPFLATAYYYRCLVLLARMSEQLGYIDKTATYSELASKVKDGINAAFLNEGEYYDTNSQTANALALYLEFVPEASKAAVLGRLVEDILSKKTMTVGCLGAEAILSALAENGRNDIAYYLANNTNKGCWGYWIKEYASTTALESFSDNRSSNNHAFLIGGLSSWFYKHVAGISPLKPGYEEIKIKPFIPDDMSSASAQIQTVRGMVKSSWQKNGTELVLHVVIPPNATAKVYVPSVDLGNYDIYSVGSGNHSFTGKSQIRS